MRTFFQPDLADTRRVDKRKGRHEREELARGAGYHYGRYERTRALPRPLPSRSPVKAVVWGGRQALFDSSTDVDSDARSIILREHHFERWAEFAGHMESLKSENSLASKFEAAADAVICGDVKKLQRLLRHDSELIRFRSPRKHHATLLHYVGANGVEAFRQKTPKNAVEVVRTLLSAGADVDATADMYGGGSTTLGLVATSIHPLLAGAQDALIETLLEAGAGYSRVGCMSFG